MAKEKKVPKKIEREAKVNHAVEEEKDLDVEDADLENDNEESDEVAPAKIQSKKVKEEVEEEVEEDYLEQYQYKKVNNVPTIGGKMTNPDNGSKAQIMKASLLKQRRVSMLIPLPEGSDPKVLHSITLNGYRLDFPTNTYIEVPEQIMKKVSEANNQTQTALNQFKISGNSGKEAAL